MNPLSLRQLRMFMDVAHTLNLGTSADRLSLTRGALSQGIKNLEQHLGRPLFERHQGRLLLNSHGRQLLPVAEELLAREQALVEQFHQGKGNTKLRIGASATIGNYLLPDTIASLWPKPWSLPEVVLANSEQLQRQLHDRHLDVAFVETNRIHTELLHRIWRQDEMILIAHPNHPLVGQQAHWHQLASLPWVLRESGSGSRDQFDHFVAPHLPHSNIVLELSAIEAVINAVIAGLGITLVSKLACLRQLEAGLVAAITLPSPIVRNLSVVFPPGIEQLPQLQYLLEALNIDKTTVHK